VYGSCPTGNLPLKGLDEQISEIESLQEIRIHSAALVCSIIQSIAPVSGPNGLRSLYSRARVGLISLSVFEPYGLIAYFENDGPLFVPKG
jgi:hypothetical protein